MFELRQLQQFELLPNFTVTNSVRKPIRSAFGSQRKSMQILSSLCCWRCCCCCFYCCRVPVLLNFSCSAIFGSLGALLIRVFWSRLCSPAQPNFQIAVNFLPAQELLPCTLFTPFPGSCCWCSCLSYEKFAACKSCCQYQKLSSLPERKTFNN